MYQLRTKALAADARASFILKLEAWGQEFGGAWVFLNDETSVFYFKGDAPQANIVALEQWPEVVSVVSESAPPFTVSEIANKQVTIQDAMFGNGAASNNFSDRINRP